MALAFLPKLQDCYAQGARYEEILETLKATIRLHSANRGETATAQLLTTSICEKGFSSSMDLARSKNDVRIRLTEERWLHITEEHSEMAGYYFDVLETVEAPDAIYRARQENA
jgi:hypothetical protein